MRSIKFPSTPLRERFNMATQYGTLDLLENCHPEQQLKNVRVEGRALPLKHGFDKLTMTFAQLLHAGKV